MHTFFRLTDDQGSADVGFRNPDSVFVTPNLDALAADAVRLSNYYVHPTCSPTRAALMTGSRTFRCQSTVYIEYHRDCTADVVFHYCLKE